MLDTDLSEPKTFGRNVFITFLVKVVWRPGKSVSNIFYRNYAHSWLQFQHISLSEMPCCDIIITWKNAQQERQQTLSNCLWDE